MSPLSKTTLSPQNLETSISTLRSQEEYAYSDSGSSIFCQTMKDLQDQIPELSQYIAPVTQGRTFTCSTYTLTFKGIELALKILNINAVVVRSLDDFKKAISNENIKNVLICDSGTLQMKETSNYPVAVCVERIGTGLQAILTDEIIIAFDDFSLDHTLNYKQFVSEVFPKRNVSIYVEKHLGKKYGSVLESSYAIKLANLFAKTFDISCIQSKGYPRIDLLHNLATYEQLSHQEKIIRHLYSKMQEENSDEKKDDDTSTPNRRLIIEVSSRQNASQALDVPKSDAPSLFSSVKSYAMSFFK